MASKILVVDDDAALAEMICIVLEDKGFQTVHCADGGEAFNVFTNEQPDLVLLDIMLPGLDGVTVCKLIRAQSAVPIIMLTARADTSDVVDGLEAGADDYVPKPFKSKELVARIKARLRETTETDADTIKIADLEIDLAGHQVLRAGQSLPLTPLEYDLIVALAQNPGRVCSREELLDKVWGYRYASDTRLVNVHIQRLRSKVEVDPDEPQIIVTVRGVGYRIGSTAG